MGYFYDLFPCVIYEEEVPEGFKVPSMYFPPAFSFDGNDTNQTFMKTFNLSVKLFHKGSHAALDAAETIADAVRAKRMIIPMINQDGTPTGDYIRLTRIDTRKGDGFVSIIITWSSRYFYDRETWPSINGVTIENQLKE